MKPFPVNEPPRDDAAPAPSVNRRISLPRGSVLTVAGSDSGGGAGIQGDIKTITLLGSYASSVITCLTAQNSLGVNATFAPPIDFFSEQLRTVLSDIPVDVIKTGMLYSAEIIRALTEALQLFDTKILVIDPVMTAKGGWELLEGDARTALVQELLPRCWLITPNIPETEQFTGMQVTDEQTMIAAAFRLQEMGARNVLIKGGHMTGDECVDILLDGETVIRFAERRIDHGNTHGTGCTYASAISALLAQGMALPDAVFRAKLFVTAAIRHALPMGAGHGPLNHFRAAQIFSAGMGDG